MEIRVMPYWQSAKINASEVVVVIDTFRASSTIVTAIALGCNSIYPVRTIEDAWSKAREIGFKNTMLGGERQGCKIEGFNLGNSPQEYTSSKVKDKIIVFTTTNGTMALTNAKEAKAVLIGCILNAAATAQTVWALKTNALTIVCSGTQGKFSLEDILAAGYIIKKIIYLNGRGNIVFKDDYCFCALSLAYTHGNNPLPLLTECLNGKKLLSRGLVKDIKWCAQVDKFDTMPVYRKNLILPLN